MGVAVALDGIPGSMPSAGETGPPKRIVVAYGFWIFLLSDIVMFAALFASYAVSCAPRPAVRPVPVVQSGHGRDRNCLLVSSYLRTMSLAVNSASRDLSGGPDHICTRSRFGLEIRDSQHDRHRRDAGGRLSSAFFARRMLQAASRSG
jgi:hypothetical protein